MAVLERDVLEPLVAAIAEVGEDASCRDLLTAVISKLAGRMDLLCNVLDSPVQSCFERMLTGPLHPLVSRRIAHFLQENDAALTQDPIDDASVYLGGGVIAAMFHCLDTFQGVDDSVQRILTILSLGLSAAGASGSPYDDLPRGGHRGGPAPASHGIKGPGSPARGGGAGNEVEGGGANAPEDRKHRPAGGAHAHEPDRGEHQAAGGEAL